jgi:tRNA-modifying protein YgfZ
LRPPFPAARTQTLRMTTLSNAPTLATAAGTWHAPRADLMRALTGPAWAALDELGVIAVTGTDAASFLQAQLTNDSAGLDAVRVQLNGYCTAKGRLIAVFDQWRDGDAICLQLPREILAPVMKRLSMFVLRAKARLDDASAQWTTFGLVGPGTTALLRDSFGAAPDVGQAAVAEGVRINRLADGTQARERFVLRCHAAQAATVRGRMRAAQPVEAGVWWWSQIDAAHPNVVAATQEAFVPQMINLEVLGGVNFKKGCYPGQEVVARSQYLGKLRRRMSLAQVDADHVAAGGDVWFVGQDDPAGKIVLAAAAPSGGMDLLIECPVDRIETQSLHIGGAPLTLRPLPYTLFDVTA